MTDFVGKFLNKIDKKGRVSVPALWRPKLLGAEFSGIVAQLTNGYCSVDGYSKKYLAEEEFAKENKLGIWSGDFIRPEEWRKKNK